MKLYELYREEDGPDDGAFHDGKLYSVNILVKLSDDLPTEDIPMSDLEWMLPCDGIDDDRLEKADPSVPIIVTDWNGETVVLDGAHRLTKAKEQGLENLPAKRVTQEILAMAEKKRKL